MKHEVTVLPQAQRDAQTIYDWICERSPIGAARWFDAYQEALKGLERSPERHGYAPENEDHPKEIRQVIFKTRHGLPYRALFTIERGAVYVLHVRGPGQRLLGPHEI